MTRWKNFARIFIVMNGVGCGVALFLRCGLGSDPIGILCEGISRSLNISFGNASLIYSLIIIALAVIAARGNIGIGTIVYAVTSGYFIDFYMWLLKPLQLGDLNIFRRILAYAIGQIILTLALAILIKYKLGMNALDAIIYKVEAVTRIPYMVIRTGIDILFTVIGFKLGGVFGIGTIISVLTTGFLVGFNIKFMEKLDKRTVLKKNIRKDCEVDYEKV